MRLCALYLHNFRLYEEALFEFSPGLNVIRGANARGKTSILEAIFFLMTGRSFRTSQTTDLIRYGAPFFYIEASFIKHDIEQKLRIYYNGKERKVTYNSTPCSSSLAFLGLIQGVVMHPDDSSIVKGAPSTRRHLLDVQLAQVDPLYVHYLTRYEKAMRQRNHLLRARSVAAIESWEYEMANAAAYIVKQRTQASADLHTLGSSLYKELCGGNEPLSLLYKAHGAGQDIPSTEAGLRELFYNQFQKHRPKEMDLGATLTGPHKDDLQISLSGKDAKVFASEGQQRSCVAALRLAEWQRLNRLSHEMPLMLVDDLGISLDNSRRAYMLEHLNTLGQVFMTTTERAQLRANEHSIEM